jgi:hypothetical protein
MHLESINSITHKSQSVTNWVRYKKYLIIALGLNKYCSLISYQLFNRLKYCINAMEQSANKLYTFSIQRFLLPTIIRY